MKSDNRTVAPQTTEAEAVFELWKEDNMGNYSEDFYDFMTTPSSARTRFMASLELSGSFKGKLMFNDITAPTE